MSAVVALESTDLTRIGVIATVALVVVGALLSLIVTAVVGRVIILVVVVGLGILVWQQRAEIQNHVNQCRLNVSFVGVHVDAPADVVSKCRAAHRVAA
jgi:hypothetical protein